MSGQHPTGFKPFDPRQRPDRLARIRRERRDALFVGDALATKAVTTGEEGPRVAPFTADADEAVRSLARIENVEARWVLPGHGQAWTSGVAEAIRLVRERASKAQR